MNDATHQKESEKTGKRKAGEEKIIDRFQRSCVLPSAVVQRAVRRKSGLLEGSAWGKRDPWKSQQPFRPNPKGAGNRPTTLRRLFIGVS